MQETLLQNLQHDLTSVAHHQTFPCRCAVSCNGCLLLARPVPPLPHPLRGTALQDADVLDASCHKLICGNQGPAVAAHAGEPLDVSFLVQGPASRRHAEKHFQATSLHHRPHLLCSPLAFVPCPELSSEAPTEQYRMTPFSGSTMGRMSWMNRGLTCMGPHALGCAHQVMSAACENTIATQPLTSVPLNTPNSA